MGKLTVETQTEVVILPISAFYHKSLDGLSLFFSTSASSSLDLATWVKTFIQIGICCLWKQIQEEVQHVH